MDNKLQIYLYTLIIDIILIIILLTQNLNHFDTFFTYSIFILHIIFYYSLKMTNKRLINILHYILFITITVGILLSNKYLVLLCIAVLILIQVLWIINKKCILNNISHIEHGYGESVTILTVLLTIVYFIKLFKIINK